MRKEQRRAARFEALVRPHMEHLYRVAYRYTGSVEDAEDAVQELLVKLYPKTDELVGLDQPRPWLVRALRNQLTDGHRRQQRSPLGHLRAVDAGDGSLGLDDLRHPAPGPAEEHAQAVARQSLEAGLRALSEEHRELIVLHDMEGYTLTELQSVLELPLGTLKSRLHRARERLRRMLEMEPFEDD